MTTELQGLSNGLGIAWRSVRKGWIHRFSIDVSWNYYITGWLWGNIESRKPCVSWGKPWFPGDFPLLKKMVIHFSDYHNFRYVNSWNRPLVSWQSYGKWFIHTCLAIKNDMIASCSYIKLSDDIIPSEL